MKNTLLNYERESVEMELGFGKRNYNVPDYFSKDVNISEIIPEIIDLIQVYKMSDGDKLERVSFELYGTTDYWDILLMLNEINPLFEMPLQDNSLLEITEEFVFNYQNFVYSHAPLIQSRADELLEEYKERNIDENDKLRLLYVIKPSKMGEFILLLKEKGYI